MLLWDTDTPSERPHGDKKESEKEREKRDAAKYEDSYGELFDGGTEMSRDWDWLEMSCSLVRVDEEWFRFLPFEVLER